MLANYKICFHRPFDRLQFYDSFSCRVRQVDIIVLIKLARLRYAPIYSFTDGWNRSITADIKKLEVSQLRYKLSVFVYIYCPN